MAMYKVTVCQLGYVSVEADSEEEAKRLVTGLSVDQICWYGLSDRTSPFLVAYAERET